MFKNFTDVYNRRQMGVVGGETNLIRQRLKSCQSLYNKQLYGHFGCVNALGINKTGSLMASGGDDRRILIWNVEKALDENSHDPQIMQGEHDSNIFCLDFDFETKNVFSGGNDERVLIHDIETSKFVNQYLQEEPVFGISCHPDNVDIFVTACSDGQILLYDIRDSSSSDDQLTLAVSMQPFHSVAFNPVEPRLVVTADQTDGVCLWDIRKPRQKILEYGATRFKRRGAMSVCFNADGTRILALGRRQPATLYNLHSPVKLVEFDHPGYFNSCTMKSGCFGGVDDDLVLSGSDDFNLYVWKIPEESLQDETISNCSVTNARLVLRGHRSIVNQVRYNPSHFLFASCGIEKTIKLWSPLYLPGGSGQLESLTEEEMRGRKIMSRESYYQMLRRSDTLATDDPSNNSTAESPRMIAFFDSLVRRDIEDASSSSDEDSTSLFSEIESSSSSDSEAGETSESIRNSSEFGSQDTSFGLRGEQSDQSDQDEDSIGKVIRRKKRQLAEKDSHHHSNHRKTSSEIFSELNAVAKAKFMLRLEDNSASDMNSQDSSDSSEVEEEAQTSFKQNLIDSSMNIPAALQDSNALSSEDETMREEIVISLRAELEEREKLLEEDAVAATATTTAATTGEGDKSGLSNNNLGSPPKLDPTQSTEIDDDNVETENQQKETPKFKKGFLSSKRSYRKRSHEDD